MTKPEAALLTNRSVCRVSGDEARTFLQGLLTQDILHLTTGQAAFTALLTPQGKILFDFFITPQADGFLIDCHASATPALLDRLKLYKLRAKVSLEPCENLQVAAIFGAAPRRADDEVIYFTDPRLKALGERVIGDPETLAKTLVRFGAADTDAYDNRRRALGVPEFGEEFGGEEAFLLDVNYDALNGVSYSKGCFVGQEVTSRMKRKGAVRKRTMIAEIEGNAPAKGAAIIAGESTLGEILSSAKGKALALIRLDRWEKAKAAHHTPVCDGRALHLLLPGYLEQS